MPWLNLILSPLAAGMDELLPIAGACRCPGRHGDAHLKARLVRPSETIPLNINGQLGLWRWQTIFFCEFDGPRQRRSVAVTVLGQG